MDKVNPLVKLEELTQQMLLGLETSSYEEMEQFTDTREQIVTTLTLYFGKHPSTEEDKKRIEHVLSFDALIRERMDVLKNEAAQWLVQRNQSKTQRNAYETAYMPEAYLMDSRK